MNNGNVNFNLIMAEHSVILGKKRLKLLSIQMQGMCFCQVKCCNQ